MICIYWETDVRILSWHWTSFCGDLISRKLRSSTELFLKCVVNINDYCMHVDKSTKGNQYSTKVRILIEILHLPWLRLYAYPLQQSAMCWVHIKIEFPHRNVNPSSVDILSIYAQISLRWLSGRRLYRRAKGRVGQSQTLDVRHER